MRGGITFVEADGEWPDTPVEVPERVYTEDEISEALANRALTEDQGWYLHVQGISWQIQVQRKG